MVSIGGDALVTPFAIANEKSRSDDVRCVLSELLHHPRYESIAKQLVHPLAADLFLVLSKAWTNFNSDLLVNGKLSDEAISRALTDPVPTLDTIPHGCVHPARRATRESLTTMGVFLICRA